MIKPENPWKIPQKTLKFAWGQFSVPDDREGFFQIFDDRGILGWSHLFIPGIISSEKSIVSLTS